MIVIHVLTLAQAIVMHRNTIRNWVKTGRISPKPGPGKGLRFTPVTTSREGIYVCGAFQSPKAIPRSVPEASAAAAEVAKALVEGRGTLARAKTYPPEHAVAGEEPRIGVFVCCCGLNIAGVVDVKELAEYARTLPNVVLVENNLFTCSTDTQVLIAEKIKELNLNRIVVAACTPRTHEPLFQDTLQEAGLNAYLLEMANIRNQNAWVHQKDPAFATLKARDQVRNEVTPGAGRGVGCVEAPRGTLIHDYVTDADGLISRANIIVGTTQNVAPMNMSLRQVAESVIQKGVVTEEALNKVEMAVRAYDPWLSCATHRLDGGRTVEIEIFDARGALVSRA